MINIPSNDKNDNNHPQKIDISQFKSNNIMKIINFQLNSNGSLKEFTEINLNELFLCNNQKLFHDRLHFGVSLHRKCHWNINQMRMYAQIQDKLSFNEIYLSLENELYPFQFQSMPKNRFFLVNTLAGL